MLMFLRLCRPAPLLPGPSYPPVIEDFSYDRRKACDGLRRSAQGLRGDSEVLPDATIHGQANPPNPNGLSHGVSAGYRRIAGRRTQLAYLPCFHEARAENRPVFGKMYVSAGSALCNFTNLRVFGPRNAGLFERHPAAGFRCGPGIRRTEKKWLLRSWNLLWQQPDDPQNAPPASSLSARGLWRGFCERRAGAAGRQKPRNIPTREAGMWLVFNDVLRNFGRGCRVLSCGGFGAPYELPLSSFFHRSHASSRALRLASLASGASPARMNPWPAPS